VQRVLFTIDRYRNGMVLTYIFPSSAGASDLLAMSQTIRLSCLPLKEFGV